MNILPKKSWHVRTKKNIERVRRDEANAAKEEKELKRRIQLAEQEARTELLRKRAKADYTEKDSSESSSKHLNFFQDIEEAGGFTGGVNKEHEEEEKAITEKYEKNIGLLTYLGQSSSEAKGEVPWYLKSSLKESSTDDGKDEAASTKHKSLIDPLKDMEKFLAVKKKKHGEKELFLFKKVTEDKKKKDKKEVDPKGKLSKIEELRAKRLKREAEERKRSQKFLESLRTGSLDPEPANIMDDRSRKYNSQFNPHLVRNNYSKNYYPKN